MPKKDSRTQDLFSVGGALPSGADGQKPPQFLADLSNRADLKDHFTTVFNEILVPTAPLLRTSALSKLVSKYLLGVLNAAYSKSQRVSDFWSEPPGFAKLKVVCRTEQTDAPIKLGILDGDQRKTLFGTGANLESLKVLSSKEPTLYLEETLFVIPGIGIVWWNASDPAQELISYSKGTVILLPYDRLLEYSLKSPLDGENPRSLALMLKGREELKRNETVKTEVWNVGQSARAIARAVQHEIKFGRAESDTSL